MTPGENRIVKSALFKQQEAEKNNKRQKRNKIALNHIDKNKQLKQF